MPKASSAQHSLQFWHLLATWVFLLPMLGEDRLCQLRFDRQARWRAQYNSQVRARCQASHTAKDFSSHCWLQEWIRRAQIAPKTSARALEYRIAAPAATECSQ